MKTGYIRIINGIVKFEFYELKKPLKRNYPWDGYHEAHFDRALKAYEASKRTVEVVNAQTVYDGYYFDLQKPDKLGHTAKMIKNNQPCKAEVIDNEAIITKIS